MSPSPVSPPDDGDALAALRAMLLEPEQKRLDELESRQQDPRSRIEEIERLIPQAMEQAIQDGSLNRTLAVQIKTGLSEAIRRDASGIAKVLFPVMGPSIRHAVVESLRDFLLQMNGAVYNTVTGQALRWRIEAMRSGKKYSQVVLERTLRFSVEQVLLIHGETGLLVSKAELQEVVAKDTDSFSAMLTAIQDFVSDSISGDTKLSTIDMGERTVWIIRGAEAHLACVISGVPTPKLRHRLAGVLDELHLKYGQELQAFSGDPSGLHALGAALETCLGSDAESRRAPAPRWPVYLLGLTLFAAMLWSVWGEICVGRRLEQALDAEPGYVILDIERRWSGWSVRGFADPLANTLDRVLATADVGERAVQFQFEPYLSLDPQMVLRRARSQLHIPDSVEARIKDGVLSLSGVAERAWVQTTADRGLPAGVDRLDVSQVYDQSAWSAFREALPPTVQAEIGADGVELRGVAPHARILSTVQLLQSKLLPPLADVSELTPSEWEEALAIQTRFTGRAVLFEDLLHVSAQQERELQNLRESLRRLDAIAALLGLRPVLSLQAHSDGLGSYAQNRSLRLERVHFVEKALGIDELDQVTVHSSISRIFDHPEVADPKMRRVDFKLQIPEPSRPWVEVQS